MEPQQKYSIATCNDFVPESLRFWLYLSFVLVFQLSGGIYLALAAQMMGARGFLREDVAMAGYASFVGMTLIFPILFPLKFRFTGKSTLIFCALGLVACNLIAMRTTSLPVLVATCFFAGALRMVGTFECNSTIQLKVTPTRDFAVFFPFLYLVILGMIPVSGLVAGFVAQRFGWQYMHILVIGLLLLVVLCSLVLLRHVRFPAHGPSVRIDWVGCALWSLLLLQTIYVLEYGEHFEWFASAHICAATVGALVCLLVIRLRNFYVKHPFVQFRALGYANVPTMLALFTAMCVLVATSNVLQGAFTGGVLGYGYPETLSLNWPVLVGTVCGIGVSYLALAKLEVGYRAMTILGFVMILGYLVGMYLLVSPETTRAAMFLPLALRGAGCAVLYVVLSVYASRTVPFLHFFHLLAFFGFVHTDLGSALGASLMGRLLSVNLHANAAAMGAVMDGRNSLVSLVPFYHLAAEFHRQVLLVSVKQAYGVASMAGVLVVVFCMGMRYRGMVRFKMPRW